MGRRRIVTKAVRAEIEERAEALAVQLSDGDLTREEVNDLVSSVVESALGTALEVAGAPDSVADAVAKLGAHLTERIAEALRPDPENLIRKATEALSRGKFDRARRLMDRAERVAERQGASDD